MVSDLENRLEKLESVFQTKELFFQEYTIDVVGAALPRKTTHHIYIDYCVFQLSFILVKNM